MAGNGPIIGGRAHSIEEVRQVCALGYPFAEVSLLDPREVETVLDELLELKRQTGISYLAHYPNEDDPFDADVLRQRFLPRLKRLLALSAELGIPKGTIHFWIDARWASPDLIERKIGLLGEIADCAGEHGVVLCLENLTERVESFQKAFDEVPALRMTLDIGHAQLLSRVNTSFGFIRDAFERIDHVHVHDNRGGTSVKDDLHLCLGEGSIDYPEIFRQLKDKGYHSTITMEVSPADMEKTHGILKTCFLLP
ncbi:MAG: sugar phosphate isomerase/epimerase family protein [Desulfomonilia bacterium]|jgi:sugar phosphate isomerase/epimerase